MADRSYALIYRMCQVQVFSSQLHARGFPTIGKYGPKTPPKMAGVTKYAIGFGRYSGFVLRFCREGPIRATQKPVARAFLAPGLADAPLSPRPHFRFCRPRVRYASGWIRRPEGLRLSPSLFSLVFRQHSRNMQVAEAFCLPGSEIERCGSFGCRIGPECRLLPVRQPASQCPSRRLVDRRRRHPIPLGRRRLACRVWNKRPFPVQRPSRATSASSLSRYCPYWFLSMGSATSRSFSSDIHPLR